MPKQHTKTILNKYSMPGSLDQLKSQSKAPLCIGLLLDDSLDSSDGVQQYVLTLGSWLTQQGHDVHYICGQTKRNDLANLHPLSRNTRVRFNKNVLSIPRGASRTAIRLLLDRYKFDVLHVQMPFSPLLAGRVINAAPSTTKIIGTFHILPASRGAAIGTRLLGHITRRQLKRFDSCISVSEPARLYMKQAFKLDSVVIPNAIEVAKFAAGNGPKQLSVGAAASEKKIVFLGRLVPRKGARYLLEAFAHLSPDHNAKLIIGGTGNLLSSLVARSMQLGLEGRVRFVGYVDEPHKSRFLADADIAVFPSTSGESFGIILLEAMAAGAGVVLGGNNPGYASVLTDKSMVFDPKDTAGLAARLDGLLSYPVVAQKMHNVQQAMVKKYDIGVVGPQILSVYQAVDGQ